MKNTFKNIVAMLLLILLGSMHANAQFNPTNPPEPEENLYYMINVTASPAAAAYTYGTGKFLKGKSTDVKYSIKNSNYKFSHWTINGEIYSKNSSFKYTVEDHDAEFVAHFEYNPNSPQEPSASDEYKLILKSNNDAACSFNIASGKRYLMDNYVKLTVYVNQGYEFLGWYCNGVLLSENTTFNYMMPGNDVTLTAKFIYNPTSPDEPDSDGSQTNIQNTTAGDVNKDGVIDVLDIVAIVNYSLGEAEDNITSFDVNNDGILDILDIVKVVNKSME